MHYVIIGGGIAGVSLADELARRTQETDQTHEIVLLEAENSLAFHTSSRAAQQLTPTYGPTAVRELSRITMDMMEQLPEKFTWASSLMLFGTAEAVDEHLYPGMPVLTAEEVAERAPELDPPAEAGGLEPDSVRINALDFLHFLAARAQQSGARFVTNARVVDATRDASQDTWSVTTQSADGASETFVADVVINASGAWADETAELFGARRLGLTPLRRTAIEAKVSAPLDPAHPLVEHATLGYYYRPDALGIVASPGDEVPSIAEDAKPRDEDVQQLLDNLRATTTLEPELIRAWCGLRTASRDGEPVVGFDPDQGGFFWLAGQSGYGFQTSLAMATLATDLLVTGAAGDWISAEAVQLLNPGRSFPEAADTSL